jgi:hypothetical protein
MVEPVQTAAAPTYETQPKRTPVTHTTKRGIATASFALGFWGTVVFWWYPVGMALCVVGLVLGLISVALGIRAGKDGEHIAWLGVAFSSIGLGLALTVYRFVQYAFQGSLTGGLFNP